MVFIAEDRSTKLVELRSAKFVEDRAANFVEARTVTIVEIRFADIVVDVVLDGSADRSRVRKSAGCRIRYEAQTSWSVPFPTGTGTNG